MHSMAPSMAVNAIVCAMIMLLPRQGAKATQAAKASVHQVAQRAQAASITQLTLQSNQ
jgi:hypothetical protein